MADIGIKPVRKGMNLSHPVGGALPDEGGLWPEDQFTFRRLEDGDVKRVAPDVDKPADPEPPVSKKAAASRAPKKAIKAATAKAPAAVEPIPVPVSDPTPAADLASPAPEEVS